MPTRFYPGSSNTQQTPLPRNDSVRFTVHNQYAAAPIESRSSSSDSGHSTPSSSHGDSTRAHTGSAQSLGKSELSSEDDASKPSATEEAADLPDQAPEPDDSYRMRHGWDSQYKEEQLKELTSNFYLYYTDKRHERRVDASQLTHKDDPFPLDWRMRDRLKTVFAVAILCLNIGVDPPDVLKTSPAARTECWIDPMTATSPSGDNVALAQIAKALEVQYQSLSLRTKYKVITDPSQEETKKFCVNVRKNAKEERVLFHYNGHGVPKPTTGGEIWVFNKDYTQYIPIALYDLQSWLAAPSLFVWDSSLAGLIVNNFKGFIDKHELENESILRRDPKAQVRSYKDCIHLGACREDELLPSTPLVPADLFTSCLTTPIEIAIRYFVLRNPLPSPFTEDDLRQIPGKTQERRTPMGELNWIFTAITDTIAWNTLPRPLFKKLFRQDLMVAALFRNFLLAQRIMRTFNCRPVSYPELPSLHEHHLWGSWDLAVELVLIQLPELQKNEHREKQYEYQHSDFFSQQLTAFGLYLEDGASLKKEPEQLPIVLQVLLSQVHRVRALILLSKFLDHGPWAVHLALSIGIFPYVLKLLQSQAPELKPSLIFIWTRVLAVDQSCQADLHKDNGYQYFAAIMQPNSALPTRKLSEHRAMCAFILAMFCRGNRTTQQAALHSDVLILCLRYVSIQDTENPLLRQWSCLCLSTLWDGFPEARWAGVKSGAHYRLCELSLDPVPEVRTAMLVAMTTWVGLPDYAGQVQEIEELVAMKLLPMCDDGSNLVRREMVCFLAVFVERYRDEMVDVACEQLQQDVGVALRSLSPMLCQHLATSQRPPSSDGGSVVGSLGSAEQRAGSFENEQAHDGLRRTGTQSSDDSLKIPTKHAHFATPNGSFGSVSDDSKANGITPETSVGSDMHSAAFYPQRNAMMTIWKHVQLLSIDPDADVAGKASAIVDFVERQAMDEDEATNASFTLASSLTQLGGIAETRRSRTWRPGPHGDASNRLSTSNTLIDVLPQTASTAPPSRAMSRQASVTATQSDPVQLAQNVESLMSASQENQQPPSRQPRSKGHPTFHINGDSSADHPETLVKSDFFHWAKEYFTEPQMRAAEMEEPGSHEYDERIIRRAKNEAILDRTQIMKDEAGSSRWDRPYGHFDNACQPIYMVAHQFEDHLAVADKEGTIRVWDWSKQTHLHSFHNGNCYGTRVTGMQYINEDDPKALLLVGSNDGAVKLHADYWSPKDSHVAAAFHGSPDSRPSDRSGSLVFDWIQTRGQLLVVGDSKDVQVWDVASEMVDHDIPLGTSALCSSLTSDQLEGNNIAAGFTDGSVRVYDQRIASGRSVVKQWHEHKASIVNVHLQRGGQRELVSGSVDGIVKLWDIRMQKSLLSVEAVKERMSRLTVHEHAPVFAAGSHRGTIKVYNMTGQFLSSFAPSTSQPSRQPNLIKSSSATSSRQASSRPPTNAASRDPTPQARSTLMNLAHRPTLPPISALAFHPHRMVLATASVGDNGVSLFTCNEDKFVLDESVWLGRKHRAGPGSGMPMAGGGGGFGRGGAFDVGFGERGGGIGLTGGL